MRTAHCRWRTFKTDHRLQEMVGVIDGDLLERVQVLPPAALAAVVRGDNGGQALPMSTDALVKTVEELARLH